MQRYLLFFLLMFLSKFFHIFYHIQSRILLRIHYMQYAKILLRIYLELVLLMKVHHEPTEPELPAEPELPSEPETPETPEVPEVPEVPEIPEVPETPEQPAQPGTSVTDQPDTAGDNGDLTGTHTGAVNQGEPLEIDKRPELTSDLEQTGIMGTNDWVQLNTSEHDGYPDQQLAATNQISKQPAMTDEQTDNHVSGQLPQTGERTNQLGLMGLMMLMVTGLAGIVGIKRWRR